MNEIEHLLTVLSEEGAEIIQDACKAIRFGMTEIEPGQPDDNKRRLEREVAQLLAVAELLGLEIREEDKAAKREKLKKYMDYSRQIGTLEGPDNLTFQAAALKNDNVRLELMYEKAAKERGVADRLNVEMRTALEIAWPSMVHTLSGHDDPSVWVDGCGKCRVARLLTNTLKREHPSQYRCSNSLCDAKAVCSVCWGCATHCTH